MACARCRERPRQAALKRGRRAAAAYEILSSDEKRRIYDRYGEDGLKQHDAHGGGGGGGAADIFSQCARRRPRPAALLAARRRARARVRAACQAATRVLVMAVIQEAHALACHAESILTSSVLPCLLHPGMLVGGRARRFFGGGFGGGFGFGGGEEEEQTPKGHDVRVDLEVTLRDLYVGTTIRARPRRAARARPPPACLGALTCSPWRGRNRCGWALWLSAARQPACLSAASGGGAPLSSAMPCAARGMLTAPGARARAGAARQAGRAAGQGHAQVQLPQQGRHAPARPRHVPAIPAAGVPGVRQRRVRARGRGAQRRGGARHDRPPGAPPPRRAPRAQGLPLSSSRRRLLQ